MGHTQALGMAEAVQDGTIDLDMALQYHLQHNHYPPLPFEAIGTAKLAIEKCAAGEPEATVGVPAGLVPARRVVEVWHLEPFVDAMSPDFWDDSYEEEA